MSSNLDSQHKGVPVNRTRIPNVPAARALLLAGALALSAPAAVLTVDAGTAAAATARPAAPTAGPGLFGTITAVSDNTLTISVMPTHRSAKVSLTSATTYAVNGKSTKTRPSLKKGTQVQIVAVKGKNGVYTARQVSVGRPAGPGGPGGTPPGAGSPPVSGTVVSASGSSLVVKTSVGKTTFKLTSSTHYLVNGKATTSRPTLKAGQAIHVMGASSGSMRTAQLVIIGAMPAPPSGPPPGQ
jgi:hypothetical protein